LNTLGDVKATVRSIIGDDDSNGWLSDDYLVPKINFAYRFYYLYIKNATGANLERMVEIPAATDVNGNPITQGLTTLAKFQQPGNLLDGLYEPLFLFWKLAGSPEYCYRQMVEKKTILPGQSVAGGSSQPVNFWGTNAFGWTWRGNQIFLSPISSFAVDFLVDGRFNPPALVKDTDQLVVDPDMEICVTPATLAIIGTESGNASYTAAGAQAELAADNIVAKLIRQKQGFTARAGSNNRRQRGCGWFWS
jgi:hypothetical protein